MRIVVAPTIMAAALLLAPMAQAQIETREGIALQNQIYQLRQELKSAEDQMSRRGGSQSPVYARKPEARNC